MTERAKRDEGAALFAATGARVTTIADSAGFIAQRILACRRQHRPAPSPRRVSGRLRTSTMPSASGAAIRWDR